MEPKLELVGYDMEVGALAIEGGWWDNRRWGKMVDLFCAFFFIYIWFNYFFIKEDGGT